MLVLAIGCAPAEAGTIGSGLADGPDDFNSGPCRDDWDCAWGSECEIIGSAEVGVCSEVSSERPCLTSHQCSDGWICGAGGICEQAIDSCADYNPNDAPRPDESVIDAENSRVDDGGNSIAQEPLDDAHRQETYRKYLEESTNDDSPARATLVTARQETDQLDGLGAHDPGLAREAARHFAALHEIKQHAIEVRSTLEFYFDYGSVAHPVTDCAQLLDPRIGTLAQGAWPDSNDLNYFRVCIDNTYRPLLDELRRLETDGDLPRTVGLLTASWGRAIDAMEREVFTDGTNFHDMDCDEYARVRELPQAVLGQMRLLLSAAELQAEMFPVTEIEPLFFSNCENRWIGNEINFGELAVLTRDHWDDACPANPGHFRREDWYSGLDATAVELRNNHNGVEGFLNEVRGRAHEARDEDLREAALLNNLAPDFLRNHPQLTDAHERILAERTQHDARLMWAGLGMGVGCGLSTAMAAAWTGPWALVAGTAAGLICVGDVIVSYLALRRAATLYRHMLSYRYFGVSAYLATSANIAEARSRLAQEAIGLPLAFLGAVGDLRTAFVTIRRGALGELARRYHRTVDIHIGPRPGRTQYHAWIHVHYGDTNQWNRWNGMGGHAWTDFEPRLIREGHVYNIAEIDPITGAFHARGRIADLNGNLLGRFKKTVYPKTMSRYEIDHLGDLALRTADPDAFTLPVPHATDTVFEFEPGSSTRGTFASNVKRFDGTVMRIQGAWTYDGTLGRRVLVTHYPQLNYGLVDEARLAHPSTGRTLLGAARVVAEQRGPSSCFEPIRAAIAGVGGFYDDGDMEGYLFGPQDLGSMLLSLYGNEDIEDWNQALGIFVDGESATVEWGDLLADGSRFRDSRSCSRADLLDDLEDLTEAYTGSRPSHHEVFLPAISGGGR